MKPFLENSNITRLGSNTAETKIFNDYRITVKAVFQFSYSFFKDLLQYKQKNIELLTNLEYFQFVQSFTYKADYKEYLTRAKLLLSLASKGHYFDCDDRTHLSLSYFILKNWLLGYEKYLIRAHVTGRGEDPKHIFAAFKDTDKKEPWVIFDPTYLYNVYGEYLYTPYYHKIFTYDNKTEKLFETDATDRQVF